MKFPDNVVGEMALRIYIRQHSPKCLANIQRPVEAGEIKPLSEGDLSNYRYCKWVDERHLR